jgi:hypothetical protein
MKLLLAVLIILLSFGVANADLQVACGNFGITTQAATSTVEVNISPSFQPSLVIFFWNGRTNATDAVGGAAIRPGIGFATSATTRRSITAAENDASNPTATANTRRNDAAIAIFSAAGIDGLADVAMDTDGFTATIDDAFSADYRIGYCAYGGSDLTNIAIGTFNTGTSTGDVTVTGVGFEADFVLLIDATISNAENGNSANVGFSLGAATRAGPTNAVTSFSLDDNVTPSDSNRYSLTGESWAGWTAPAGPHARGSVTAFDSDGFTFNVIEAPTTGRPVYYLALKGPQFKIGNSLTQTNTSTDIVTSGFGFTPSGVMVLSHLTSASTADTQQAHTEFSIGAATSDSNQLAMAILSEDNVAASETATAIEFDNVLANISTSDAIEGSMTVKNGGWGSDGIIYIMSDADPSQSFFWYWAIGPAVVTSQRCIGCGFGRGGMID